MVCGLFFVRCKFLEVWDDMEIRIHAKQFWECFSLALIPALALSFCFGWGWMLLPFVSYHLFYWVERMFRAHSSFDWEAIAHCGDSLYLRKRKSYAWMKQYGRKDLPCTEWND
jgi:hypothetical protein